MWDKFKLIFDNVVTLFTATSEVTTFEDDNLTDGNEISLWKASSTANQDLTFDQGATKISEFATSTFDASATSPTGIAYAPDGTLWVTDQNTDKIYNIQTDGTAISSFLTSTYGGTFVAGITVAPDGTLWVGDTIQDKIFNIEMDGTLISTILTSAFTSSSIDVDGIAYDEDGTLWIADSLNDTIFNITTDGTLISFFLADVYDASANTPSGIAIGANDTLWVSDKTTAKLYNVEKDGTYIFEIDSSFYDASATSPEGIDLAPDGTLWIIDSATDKVYNSRILLDFDTLFITGHNLNTANATVLWQYSDDGSTWTDIKYAFTPVNDKTFAVLLDTPITTRAVKVKLTSLSVAPFIGNIIIGRRLEIFNPELYDPYKSRYERTKNRTLHGQTSDVTTYYKERTLDLSFNSLENDAYKVLKKFYNEKPSHIVGAIWEESNHPLDVWAVEMESDDLDAPFIATGTIRSASITLRGIEE